MNIIYKPVGELTPYANNAKKHDKVQVNNVAESIRKFGFVQPIVIDKDGVITIGHCRYMAAKKLGMKTVPCLCLDELTDDQIDELRIVDNKTNESAWDDDILSEVVSRISFDGFEFNFGLNESKKEIVEDEPPAVDNENKPIAKEGDIWQLGRHRLMCADSTKLENYEKLMDGELADCVVTDPPYNMNYEGAGNAKDRKNKRIMNDKMKDDEFEDFLRKFYSAMKEVLKEGASFYVFYKELGKGVFITALEDAGLKFNQELIWVKNQLVLGGSKYQNMYEPCLFGYKGKRINNWNAGRKERSVIETIDFMDEDELRNLIKEIMQEEETDVIRANKPLKNDLHPTMKPLKLIAKFIGNSSKPGEKILDPFGGSGSTMMTCEQMGRTCYMMELDPKYMDVIIKRWENFTGEKAVLVSESEADIMYAIMLFLFQQNRNEV